MSRSAVLSVGAVVLSDRRGNGEGLVRESMLE